MCICHHVMIDFWCFLHRCMSRWCGTSRGFSATSAFMPFNVLSTSHRQPGERMLLNSGPAISAAIIQYHVQMLTSNWQTARQATSETDNQQLSKCRLMCYGRMPYVTVHYNDGDDSMKTLNFGTTGCRAACTRIGPIRGAIICREHGALLRRFVYTLSWMGDLQQRVYASRATWAYAISTHRPNDDIS